MKNVEVPLTCVNNIVNELSKLGKPSLMIETLDYISYLIKDFMDIDLEEVKNLKKSKKSDRHETQVAILKLSEHTDISSFGLRALGKIIGVEHPQKVKYHLQKLKSEGLID